MSADNGIYILTTPTKDGGEEYRVRELMAIENVEWDESKGDYTDDDDIIIENARRMWKGAPVFTDENQALAYAMKLLRETDICEYGISPVAIPRIF